MFVGTYSTYHRRKSIEEMRRMLKMMMTWIPKQSYSEVGLHACILCIVSLNFLNSSQASTATGV